MAMPLGSAPGSSAIEALSDYLHQRPSFRATGRPSRGPDQARRLLRTLGDPQDSFPAVHVAGTAGKGSVTSFVAAILTAHDFAVGSFLSPHAYTILERFQLRGVPVAADVAIRHLADVAAAVCEIERRDGGRPTFFEVATALAYRIFEGENVDYAVIETGLGGLLDATNTITRRDKLAVLTTIGLDHTEVLGSTMEEIATQKAGILPRGGHAYAVRDQSAQVMEAIAAEARRRRCVLEFVDTAASSRAATAGPTGTVLRLPDGSDLTLGLHGRHQAGNAFLALRVVEDLARRDGWQVHPDAVREGLRQVRLPGRFEIGVWRGRKVIFDGAHNPVKVAAVVATLLDTFPGRRFAWVLALKQDKDLGGVLDAIAPVASGVVGTEFHINAGNDATTSCVPASHIVDAARRAGLPAVAQHDPAVALRCATEWFSGQSPVVVAGSFHLLAALGGLEPAP
jgi:dihydrofolate synthase / folylpolyglutamate synthase